ncbi:MAG TPA: type II/IV secretion system protein, partial [Gemmatimonadales bacterium]|nr:type II/IV secretion system protein [Gemmatimonadales bacterium]
SATLATSDPRDLAAERDLGFLTGRRIRFVVAPPARIRERLEEVYPREAELEPEAAPRAAPRDPALEAPVARLVAAVLADAVRQGASDVHLEPNEGGMIIRSRVDGILREVMRLPVPAGRAAVRRVKVLARLDVANPLVTQDGRARIRVDGRTVDLRVATAPVARRGEKAVIRLLDPAGLKTGLADLGLLPPELSALERLLGCREGLVLVTGPTGSGKTTTLYAAVQQLRTGRVNIVTVEDPVEYDLAGISQLQVNEAQGLTFPGALRSVLRQDPDIVLVGEIRDAETATIAVQAGLTGHLVLSTLHTNDAPSALVRLRDLGLGNFQLAAVLRGIVAQRLVRRLCPHCAVTVPVEELPPALRPPPAHPATVRRAHGCTECGGQGYRGRLAVPEILLADLALARLIGEGGSPAAVVAAARQGGMRALWESGLARMWDGLTSLDELTRVLGAPDLEGTAPTPPTAGAHILVADDDPGIRRLLRTVLEQEGHTVGEAEDGMAALEQVRSRRPDLVLLDAEMPRLDGFGVLAALRSEPRLAATPVLMLTARAEREVSALDQGAHDFLAKPVAPGALLARVRAALRRARL